MASRNRGDEYEQEVAKLLKFKQTANSGAMFDDADLRPLNGKPVIAEVKLKSDSYVVLSDVRQELRKLHKQADKIGKDWIYVIRGRDTRDLVICDLHFFAEATEGYFDVKE